MLRKLAILAAVVSLVTLLAAPLALAQLHPIIDSCCAQSDQVTEADSNQPPIYVDTPFPCPPILGNPPGSTCTLYDNGQAVAPNGQLFFVDENGTATLPDGRSLGTGFLQYG